MNYHYTADKSTHLMDQFMLNFLGLGLVINYTSEMELLWYHFDYVSVHQLDKLSEQGYLL